MKRLLLRSATILAIVFLATSLTVRASASDLNFNHLVSSIEGRYQIRHTRIPLMGLVSFCARVYTRDGVRGVHVADFEDIGIHISADEFDAYLHSQLGESWNVIVRSHKKTSNEDTIIYAHMKGGQYILLIADVEGNELSLVKVGMNANKLAQSSLVRTGLMKCGTSRRGTIPDKLSYNENRSDTGASE